jgi:hypothetical protein
LNPDEKEAYLGQDLIFVISMPRSGSTLLQRILAGHPDVQTSAETWLMLHPVYGLRRRGIRTDYGAGWAATGVTEFLEYYADGPATYDAGIRAFAREIYGTVLARHGKLRFVDKTPRYSLIVPDLYRLFPEARFVLLFRNPLAVLASELSTYVKEDWPKLANFAPDLLEAPGLLVEAARLLGDRAIMLRYEHLVAAPGEEMARVCAELDLTFDPRMLDYADTPAPRGVMNDPVGVQRHRKPSASSLDKWQQLGSDAQARHFALAYLNSLGPEVLAGLGYPVETLRPAIEDKPVSVRRRGIFPWDLAVRPRKHWGTADEIRAAYHLAAGRSGAVSGTFSAVGVMLGRLARTIRRSAGRPAERQA